MKEPGKEIIAHYLIKALLENGFVLLPGSGVLYLQRYPARIVNQTESIVPPGYTVDFVPSTYVADYFLSYYIAENTKTSFHFWNDKLKSLGEEINNLKTGEQYNLGGLGFFKKDDSGSLQYESNGLNGLMGCNTLEVLSCKPIPLHYKKEKFVSKEEIPTVEPSPISEKIVTKKKKGRLGLFGWFLIILAAVLFSSLIYDRCNHVLVDENIAPPPHIDQDRFNKPPDKLYVDSFQKEDSNSLDEDYRMSEGDYPLDNKDYPEDYFDSDTFYEEGIDNELFEEESKRLEEVEETEEVEEIEMDYLVVSGRCIIVTGSFSNQNNINNQSQLLENLGYSVYTENIGSLTRVGVLIDCNHDVLYSELDYLRTNVEVASWIMENN
ncbi:MAG: hypothetical protein EA362_09320 [Saprospirales bacterium]|nr:MAG: hypothetical protein EA362_09320 [Saprospirales bacterium]